MATTINVKQTNSIEDIKELILRGLAKDDHKKEKERTKELIKANLNNEFFYTWWAFKSQEDFDFVNNNGQYPRNVGKGSVAQHEERETKDREIILNNKKPAGIVHAVFLGMQGIRKLDDSFENEENLRSDLHNYPIIGLGAAKASKEQINGIKSKQLSAETVFREELRWKWDGRNLRGNKNQKTKFKIKARLVKNSSEDDQRNGRELYEASDVDVSIRPHQVIAGIIYKINNKVQFEEQTVLMDDFGRFEFISNNLHVEDFIFNRIQALSNHELREFDDFAGDVDNIPEDFKRGIILYKWVTGEDNKKLHRVYHVIKFNFSHRGRGGLQHKPQDRGYSPEELYNNVKYRGTNNTSSNNCSGVPISFNNPERNTEEYVIIPFLEQKPFDKKEKKKIKEKENLDIHIQKYIEKLATHNGKKKYWVATKDVKEIILILNEFFDVTENLFKKEGRGKRIIENPEAHRETIDAIKLLLKVIAISGKKYAIDNNIKNTGLRKIFLENNKNLTELKKDSVVINYVANLKNEDVINSMKRLYRIVSLFETLDNKKQKYSTR